jgi:excinuclease ABC subunit C
MIPLPERIAQKVAALPAHPGVYLMRNAAGEVIYVGKAVNLAQRVRSYFQRSSQEQPKVRRLVREIADLEWILTNSEVEALILEANLIKRYRPRYNVRLKDDKRYPYLQITREPFPRVRITRRFVRDGSRYFGPYTSTSALRETLDLLRHLFPFRTCDRTITGQDRRACLYYDLKLCPAPCIGAVDEATYRQTITELEQFLEGEGEAVLEALREQIEAASAEMAFERAALLRDRYRALQQVMQRQAIISTAALNQDVIAIARDEGQACVEVFFVRHGKLLGREHFVLEGAAYADEEEMVRAFLQQFYTRASTVPPEILLPEQLAEAEVLESWLRSRRGGAVYLKVPREGNEEALLRLATENAAETLRQLKATWAMDKHRAEEALRELQEALTLPRPPVRMECYDISTTQGVEVVGSMVVFEHGAPRKSDYRRFRIRTVQGQDDFASMREVLTRRFSRWQRIQAGELKGTRGSQAWGKLPDLLVIDGGKGQLAEAVAVLRHFGLEGKVPVVGLAKRREELFLPGRSRPLRLEPTSPALLLLRRLRDEAHRFAITYHRKRRRRRGLASTLEEIPGIGPVRRKALLRHFDSLEAIRQADEAALMAVPGISRALAQAIRDHFAAMEEPSAPTDPPAARE